MKLAVLIPALNEEKTIGQVIDSIPKNLPQISETQIIVVNDGSTDKTEEIAKSRNAIVVRHKKNQGLGKSFQDGLEKAMSVKADILVTIDADGQFDANEIKNLILPIINKEADFVTGSRFIDKKLTPANMPLVKRWGNHQIARVISFSTHQKFYDVSCGFRAYSSEAMLRLNLIGKFTYTQETFLDLAHKGVTIMEVPVTVKYFDGRKSRVASSLIHYAIKSFNIILRTIKDYRPMLFFGTSGVGIFLIGLALDLLIFNYYLKYNTFSPYKMVGFLGAFLNAVGIMVFFIGMLADLLDRIRLNQEKQMYMEKKAKYYTE